MQIREAYFFLAEYLPLGLWYKCTWFQDINLLCTSCFFLLRHSHIILSFEHNAANIRLKMAANRFQFIAANVKPPFAKSLAM